MALPRVGMHADLTNDAALVRLLLDDVRFWRQRLVETLSFGSADTVRVESQYQIELTAGFLQEHGLIGEGVASIRAILPLTTRPKASLLGFDLTGADGSPSRLLRRRDIAAFEAEYLRELWESSPGGSGPPDDALLEAITGFHAGRYRLSLTEEATDIDGCSRYLSETLHFPVSPTWVASWQQRLAPLRDALCTALEEPPDPLSAAEFPVLALSAMVPPPLTLEEADQVLHDYFDKVMAAELAGDVELLEALADYGRRWEVLVETALPLDQPVVITVCEDRPIEIARGRARVHLAMGDAASYHVEARLEDHSVEFSDARYRAPNETCVLSNSIEDRRDLPHSLALYSSRSPRPYYACLDVRLRLSLDQRLASLLVFVLLIGAVSVATTMDFGANGIEAMALLTVPTTFAATVVLTRSESPLAAQLSIPRRWALAAAVLALWLIAGAKAADAIRASNATSSGIEEVESVREGGRHGEERSSGQWAGRGGQRPISNP